MTRHHKNTLCVDTRKPFVFNKHIQTTPHRRTAGQYLELSSHWTGLSSQPEAYEHDGSCWLIQSAVDKTFRHPALRGKKMVHYEVVQYLMDCCGITYSQAVQALRSNDWDLWQAEASIRNNKMWEFPKCKKSTSATTNPWCAVCSPTRMERSPRWRIQKAKHLKPKLVRADGWRSTQ